MGASTGLSIPTNGLTHLWDASSVDGNPWKHNRSNILNPWMTWTSGSGGTTGYGANGSANEQLRGMTPSIEGSINYGTTGPDNIGGRYDAYWRTTPDSTSGADGGWNSSSYSIDRSYTYRWSVWVQRNTSGTGGTFYLGLNPAPIRNDNGAVQSNPYFTYPSQASLTQNQWYLVVAHCFYEGYTGSRHPDSGWYELDQTNWPGESFPRGGDMNGRFLTKISDKSYGNCGTQDVRWQPTTTSALHRTYHYYTTNTSSGLIFAYPRIDKCDGTEPTISQLATNAKTGLKNLIGTTGSGNGYFTVNDRMNDWSYIKENGIEFLRYNGDSTAGGTASPPMRMDFNYSSTNYTIIGITRYSPGTSIRGRIISGQSNNWLLGNYSNTTENNYAAGWVSSAGAGGTDTNWRVYAATGNISSDQYSFWVNGSKIVNNSTGGSQGPNGFGLMHYDPGNSEWTNGDIAYLAMYNRVLSDTEIKKISQSLKGRYGI